MRARCCGARKPPERQRSSSAGDRSTRTIPKSFAPRRALDALGGLGRARLAARAHGGPHYDTLDFRAPTALVLGNEAHGLDPALDSHLDGTVSIPMAAPAESLTVAMAATVVCFEAARQRRAGGRP